MSQLFELPSRWYVKPMVDLNATHIGTESFTEHGADGANLAVQGDGYWVLAASPAIEIGTEITAMGITYRPYVRAGGTFLDDATFDVTASFVAAPGQFLPPRQRVRRQVCRHRCRRRHPHGRWRRPQAHLRRPLFERVERAVPRRQGRGSVLMLRPGPELGSTGEVFATRPNAIAMAMAGNGWAGVLVDQALSDLDVRLTESYAEQYRKWLLHEA